MPMWIKPKPVDWVSSLVVVFEMLSSRKGTSAFAHMRPYLTPRVTVNAKDNFSLLTWACR